MNDFKLLTHVGKGYVVSDCQKELKDFGFSVMDIDRLIDVTSIIDQYEKR